MKRFPVKRFPRKLLAPSSFLLQLTFSLNVPFLWPFDSNLYLSLGHWLRRARDRVEARNSRSSRTRTVGRHTKSRPFHGAIGVEDRSPTASGGNMGHSGRDGHTHETYETSILSSGLVCHMQTHTGKRCMKRNSPASNFSRSSIPHMAGCHSLASRTSCLPGVWYRSSH